MSKKTLAATLAAAAAVAGATYAIVTATTPRAPVTWNVTPTSPTSLATAESQAQPGDTINLSGTFTHVSLVPKTSGTATAPITYTGTATFDAAGMTTTLAAITGRSYLVFDGLTFQNSVPTVPVTNRGVIVRSSSHITFSHDHFTWMQMQLIGSSYNTLSDNVWRYFVAQYVNGQPQTAGDMLNLVLGSHDNTIVRNDMKYAGHSLIEIGNGTGNSETNANNVIDNDTLSNPWYKDIILSDDGAGTTVSGNELLDANSSPALYSTVAGQVGQLQTSSDAVQFSGENYTLTGNTISNAVCTYGCVTLGSRWYPGPPAPSLIESENDTISDNTITGCHGAAAFSFVLFQAATDPSMPLLTGNAITGNKLTGNGPSS